MRRLIEGCRSAGALVAAFWRGPYWWLAPLIVVLLPAAVLFVLLKTVPVMAPFVYALF
jgi:hypothetical protein